MRAFVLGLVLLTAGVAGCLAGEGGDTSPEDPTANRSPTSGENDSIEGRDRADVTDRTGPDIPVDLVWTTLDGQLHRVDAATGNLTPIPLDGSLPNDAGVTGMRWGPDDRLYVAAVNGGAIARIDPTTWTLEVVAEGPPLEDPIALDVLSDGTVVVVDGGPDQGPVGGPASADSPAVLTVDPETGETEVLATDPRFNGPLSGRWFDLVATEDDVVYLLSTSSNTTAVTPADPSDDAGRGALWRIDPSTGQHSLVATSRDWVFPDGLEVLADGRLFVSDWAPSSPGTFTVDPSSGEVTPVTTLPNASLLWGGELLPDGRVVVSAAGEPSNATDDGSGPGGLWIVDPATGSRSLFASTPEGGQAGHARVFPPGATGGER